MLYVSDLDGTLLRPDRTLGPDTVRFVNEFVAGGGLFSYATARSFTSAARVTAGLRLELPVITYGGAVAVDPRTGRARQAQLLPAVAVARIFELTEASTKVQPIAFALLDGRDRLCWRPERATAPVTEFLRTRSTDPRLLPVPDWSAVDPAAVIYLSVLGARPALLELRAELGDLLTGCHAVLAEDIYTPDDWALDLTAAAGTKAAALTELKAEVGADQLVCFGDNLNDLTMFAVSDRAVAVGNAVPEVLAAADEVIGSNATDAVAGWLRVQLKAVDRPGFGGVW